MSYEGESQQNPYGHQLLLPSVPGARALSKEDKEWSEIHPDSSSCRQARGHIFPEDPSSFPNRHKKAHEVAVALGPQNEDERRQAVSNLLGKKKLSLYLVPIMY